MSFHNLLLKLVKKRHLGFIREEIFEAAFKENAAHFASVLNRGADVVNGFSFFSSSGSGLVNEFKGEGFAAEDRLGIGGANDGWSDGTESDSGVGNGRIMEIDESSDGSFGDGHSAPLADFFKESALGGFHFRKLNSDD
jgi:hypothetical protein